MSNFAKTAHKTRAGSVFAFAIIGAATVLAGTAGAGKALADDFARDQFARYWTGQINDRRNTGTDLAMAGNAENTDQYRLRNQKSGPDYWGVGVLSDRR